MKRIIIFMLLYFFGMKCFCSDYIVATHTVTDGTLLNIDIYIKAVTSSPSALGDATFAIAYNPSVIEYLGKISDNDGLWDDNFSSSYQNISSDNLIDRCSLNIIKTDQGSGIIIPNQMTKISRIQFRIIDQLSDPDIYWQSNLTSIYDWSENELTSSIEFIKGLSIHVNLFLEGPYQPAMNAMTTYLNTGGYLPLTSPYTEDPRTIAAVPADVTDWVLVQLRTTAAGAAVLSKSVLLHKDGKLVADDGVTEDLLLEAAADNYYAVIRHRNHLDVMSASPIPLNSTTAALCDFTIGINQYYGNEAKQIDSDPVRYGMFCGDADNNGSVNATDYLVVKVDIAKSGYFKTDCELNTSVNATDYLVIKRNVGKATSIP